MDGERAAEIGLGIESLAHAGEAVHEAAGTERFSLSAIVACLTLGCMAVLMLGVQPLVLGALLTDHRISVPQLTQAATVEMLGLGLVSGGLAGLFQHRRLRLFGLAATIVLAGANFLTLASSGEAVVLCRAAAGAAGGVLLWIATGLIARSASAVRISGIFLGAQSLSQAALAAAIPFMPAALGANAGFWAMAALCALATVLVVMLPNELSVLPKPPAVCGALSVRGTAGLLTAFMMMAGVVGLWVFVEPLAKMDGVSEQTVSFAIAASLATQILGAAFIATFGPRLPAVPSLLAVGLANLLVVGLMSAVHGSLIFTGAALLFGFLWTAGIPLVFPLLIKADPTRRVAMFSAGAQLLGSAAGPQLTGAFVTETNVRPVLFMAAGLFIAAMLSALVAGAGPKRAN